MRKIASIVSLSFALIFWLLLFIILFSNNTLDRIILVASVYYTLLSLYYSITSE